MSWPNAEPGLILSDQGLRMRELKDSGRVFGISRCPIRLKFSFGGHA